MKLRADPLQPCGAPPASGNMPVVCRKWYIPHCSLTVALFNSLTLPSPDQTTAGGPFWRTRVKKLMYRVLAQWKRTCFEIPWQLLADLYQSLSPRISSSDIGAPTSPSKTWLNIHQGAHMKRRHLPGNVQ